MIFKEVKIFSLLLLLFVVVAVILAVTQANHCERSLFVVSLRLAYFLSDLSMIKFDKAIFTDYMHPVSTWNHSL